MKNYQLTVNGFDLNAQYDENDVQDIFIPLIHRLVQLQSEKNKRIFVYIAAPPGTGKTTLTLFLEYLAKELGYEQFQSIGIDGYHYYNDYLEKHTTSINGKQVVLKSIKGHKDTFDVEKMIKNLSHLQNQNGYWPLYSRQLHQPVEEAIYVDKKIILLEGNYLLLDDSRWCDCEVYCDYSILISADKEMLRQRLIDRKHRGGTPYEKAVEWVENSDMVNVEEVLSHSKKANLTLFYDMNKFVIKD